MMAMLLPILIGMLVATTDSAPPANTPIIDYVSSQLELPIVGSVTSCYGCQFCSPHDDKVETVLHQAEFNWLKNPRACGWGTFCDTELCDSGSAASGLDEDTFQRILVKLANGSPQDLVATMAQYPELIWINSERVSVQMRWCTDAPVANIPLGDRAGAVLQLAQVML